MAIQIQFRRGTASEWSASNPVLADGELGAETDTGRFKIGNGSTVWSGLQYSSGVPGSNGMNGADGATGPTGATGPAGTGSGLSAIHPFALL